MARDEERDNSTRLTSVLERRLTRNFLMWPVFQLSATFLTGLLFSSLLVPVNGDYFYILYEYAMFFSPILTAIFVVTALRHRPVLHHLLRVVVGVSLVVAVLTNYMCATAASGGDFLNVLKGSVRYPDRSLLGKMLGLYDRFVDLPSFVGPLADYPTPLMLLFVGVKHWSLLASPYFLLLMVITPSRLAFPVFWLWVVLSVLYVVLPSKAWRWTGGALQRGWSVVWRRKSV
jgi:hypothetical protein